MKKTINKRKYKTPEIVQVVIDSDISLQLSSDPPNPVNEDTELFKKDYFNNEPYKMA